MAALRHPSDLSTKKTLNRTLYKTLRIIQRAIMPWACFIYLFSVTTAAGDVFRSETNLEPIENGERAVLRVTLENRGPSVMHDLRVCLDSPWGKEKTLVRPELAVNGVNRVEFGLDERFADQGWFPLVVWTNFRDSAAMPVSWCNVTVWPATEQGHDGLRVQSGDVDIVERTTLDFDITNTETAPKDLTARLIVPGALKGPDGHKVVQVLPQGRSRLAFSILNRAGTAGDRHTVYLVLEYDNQRHHCLVKPATVHVVARDSGPWSRGKVLTGLVILSGLAWLGSLVIGKTS